MMMAALEIPVSYSLPCPLCLEYYPSSYRLWLGHLRSVHSHDANFYVTCGVKSCPSTFRKFTSLYTHVYRKHRYMLETRAKGYDNSDLLTPNSGELANVGEADINEGPISADIQRLMGTDVDALRRQSALFLLKMKEKRLLSQVAINEIIENASAIFTNILETVQAGVREQLAITGINPSDVDLDFVFQNLTDPFNGLESKHAQEKYFKEHLGLIEPEEIQLGEPRSDVAFSGPKRRQVLRYDTFYYVPLLETLRSLLAVESVQEEIQHGMSRGRDDNYLEDLCDGSVYKNHDVFSSSPEAIQIVCYYDEIEIANPLGAYVKKHKVGVVFFTLANIRPEFRSRLTAINLAIVVKYTNVEKYGINEILKPLVQDLNVLSSRGIDVTTNNVTRNYKGALLAFVADTAASHLVGGFKKSVGSAYRMCRTCMATTDSFKLNFNSNDFQLRSTADHLLQCTQLSGSLKEHNSKVFGICEKSILLDVDHFSMCGWGLPHDVMHDLFEGVVQYEIKLLILSCVKKRFFSLATFNERLINFEYGYSEVADKPVPLTTQHINSKDAKHIRQGSAQTWLLARILPFLIANDIPESDDNWRCYLMLLKIIDICLATVVSPDLCAVLKVLIEEHHLLFTQLYPEWIVIPKMHYMLHYPEQILALGPLIRVWTMRYEGKLCLLKNGGRLSNFKNIAQSISYRHQLWMCYEFSTNTVFSNHLECGPTSISTTLNCQSQVIRSCISNIVPGISMNVIVSYVSWVKNNGTTYKSGACVLFGIDDQDMIEQTFCFGVIQEVLVVGSNLILFLICTYKSQYYDDHFHAYVVSKTSEQRVIECSSLLDPCVLYCRTVGTKLFIRLKYYVNKCF